MKKTFIILTLTAGLSLNAVQKKTVVMNTPKKMEADYTLRTQVAPAATIHNNATTKVMFKPSRSRELMKKISKNPQSGTASMFSDANGIVIKSYSVNKDGQTEITLELTACQEPLIVVTIFENFSGETFEEATSGSFDKNTESIYALTFTNDNPTITPKKSSRK